RVAAVPPATRSGAGIVGSLRSLLDADEIHAWIDRLADADPAAAENKIRSHGRRAVEPLMQALARSDLKIRSRAHRLLCEALAVDLPFDAAGHEQTRTQQIACLRDYLRERNAA
ncbi:MAG TPA: hypothetical protein VNC50_20170, partial [Planctomycetia bacterium]|nr:hypothetical protein [Planctomycetia bacterium]